MTEPKLVNFEHLKRDDQEFALDIDRATGLAYHKPFESPEEVRRFFQRLARCLAHYDAGRDKRRVPETLSRWAEFIIKHRIHFKTEEQ